MEGIVVDKWEEKKHEMPMYVPGGCILFQHVDASYHVIITKKNKEVIHRVDDKEYGKVKVGDWVSYSK